MKPMKPSKAMLKKERAILRQLCRRMGAILREAKIRGVRFRVGINAQGHAKIESYLNSQFDRDLAIGELERRMNRRA